jgi:hypothetical protein
LQTRGYTQEEHQKGWDLIGLVSGVDLKIPALVEDQEVRHALAELNQLDEDTLSLVDASLKHRYPLQANELLEGLRPSREEAEAAVVSGALLKRVDGFDQSGDAQDAEAVALLAERGLDAEVRARLQALTELARRITPVVQQPDPKEAAAAEERYVETSAPQQNLWAASGSGRSPSA